MCPVVFQEMQHLETEHQRVTAMRSKYYNMIVNF